MSDQDLLSIVEDWLSWLREERRYSNNTVDAYKRDVVDFFHLTFGRLPECSVGLRELQELDATKFREWLALRCKIGKKSASSARAIAALRNFFHYLHRKYQVKSSVIFNVSKPIIRKGLPKVLKKAQVSKIINECSSDVHWTHKRDSAIAGLLYGCGLRISEAVNVKFSNLEGESLRVLGKGRKERIVPILPWVGKLLEEYIVSCPYHSTSLKSGDKYLFVGLRGKQLGRTYFAYRMKILRRKMGLPEITTPHVLRHTFATHLFLEGADIRVVQELLGHVDLSSTQIYTHLDYNDIIEHYVGFHPQTVKKR